MQEEIEALLILQDRDQKIRHVQTQQTALPRERKSLEGKLETAKAAMETARQRSKENEVARRKLEGEVQAKQAAIGRFKTQQQQTRKNEEFQALNNEIEHFNRDIAALEDQELGLMEEADALKKSDREAEGEFERARQSISEQLSRLDGTAKSLEARLAELQADHTKLKGGVSEDSLSLYERLFARKGDSAVTALDRDICSGCHTKVPVQVALQVRQGHGLPQCPHCGRILFREP